MLDATAPHALRGPAPRYALRLSYAAAAPAALPPWRAYLMEPDAADDAAGPPPEPWRLPEWLAKVLGVLRGLYLPAAAYLHDHVAETFQLGFTVASVGATLALRRLHASEAPPAAAPAPDAPDDDSDDADDDDA